MTDDVGEFEGPEVMLALRRRRSAVCSCRVGARYLSGARCMLGLGTMSYLDEAKMVWKGGTGGVLSRWLA